MLHTTKLIVLRTIKYSETSIIVTCYTELFGIQSYIVNGVRTSKKKSIHANLFQPSMILDAIVYHVQGKNLQRIKEIKPHIYYRHLTQEVVKNTIAVYCIELITKTIIEPEPNVELFEFFEQAFLYLDNEDQQLLSNFPIYFTISIAEKLGFGIENNYSESQPVFDLQNGQFVNIKTIKHFDYIDNEEAKYLARFLQNQYDEVKHISSNHSIRATILKHLLTYLKLHIPHLGELKCVTILHEVLK